jgi:uncharacterized protein
MFSIDRQMMVRQVLPTLAVSLAGGLVAQAAHMPAGLLMGGAVAVSAASLAGLPARIPNKLRNTAFVIVGMTLGTNVAQDSLELIRQWPWSMVGLSVALVMIVAISTLVLRYVFRFDKATAYLSSFPGHLSFVLGMAESGYGDSRQIAVIQSMRILLLTILVPVVARFYSVADLSIVSIGAQMPLLTLILLALASTLGGFVFHLLKIPAAFVLGSMVVATAGKLMGLYDGRLPLILVGFGYVVMGGLIGSRFAGTTPRELGRAALGGTVVTLICVASVSLVVFGLTYVVDMPFGQLWLGLAPGALESMGALGIALGYDTAFIAAHHTARFFLLTLSVPSVGLFVGRGNRGVPR